MAYRDYRIGDKLRLLAMRLDRSDHPNPFVRAWRAFWSRNTRDDEVQRDLRIWAAALDKIGGGPESDRLRTPELDQHMEAIRKADVARRYRVTEIDCTPARPEGE